MRELEPAPVKDETDFQIAMQEQLGCICPPTLEMVCDHPLCPRKSRNGPTWDGRGCG